LYSDALRLRDHRAASPAPLTGAVPADPGEPEESLRSAARMRMRSLSRLPGRQAGAPCGGRAAPGSQPTTRRRASTLSGRNRRGASRRTLTLARHAPAVHSPGSDKSLTETCARKRLLQRYSGPTLAQASADPPRKREEKPGAAETSPVRRSLSTPGSWA